MDTFTELANGMTIVRTSKLPWMPWAGPGTWRKVLHLDVSHDRTTLMIKVEPNTPLGEHHHLGDAEAYILEGDFTYEHGGAQTGDYLCEKGGIKHVPKTGDQGLVLFGMNYGAIHGINPDGTLAGVVNQDFYYDGAVQQNTHHHLKVTLGRDARAVSATASQ